MWTSLPNLYKHIKCTQTHMQGKCFIFLIPLLTNEIFMSEKIIFSILWLNILDLILVLTMCEPVLGEVGWSIFFKLKVKLGEVWFFVKLKVKLSEIWFVFKLKSWSWVTYDETPPCKGSCLHPPSACFWSPGVKCF